MLYFVQMQTENRNGHVKSFTKSPRFTYSEVEHDHFFKSQHDLDIEIISGNRCHLMHENVFFVAKDEQRVLFHFLCWCTYGHLHLPAWAVLF